jgi:hypothetical protein
VSLTQFSAGAKQPSNHCTTENDDSHQENRQTIEHTDFRSDHADCSSSEREQL